MRKPRPASFEAPAPTSRRGALQRSIGRHTRAGFSLFELLVVIAIIGVLAAVAIPRFTDFRAAAYDARAQQDLRNLASAQELHRATNDTYAADAASLASFRPSEGVELTIESADETAFAATATHPAGKNVYRWQSDAQPALTVTPRP